MSKDVFEKYGIELPSIADADEIDNPPIIAKFTNEKWNWYVVAGDKLENEDYLLFGLVDGIYRELGTFTLSQIESVSAILTPDFDNIALYDLLEDLNTKSSV